MKNILLIIAIGFYHLTTINCQNMAVPNNDANHTAVLISPEGKIVKSFSGVMGIDRFHEGLALCIHAGENGKNMYGFINNEGEEVIAPKFNANSLDIDNVISEGLALFVTYNKDNDMTPLYGYIDTKGEVAIKPSEGVSSLFSSGLAFKKDAASQKWGYINHKGEFVIQPVYANVMHFNEGYAGVTLDNLKWGFIDPSGKVVVEMKYSKVFPFSNGMAAVALDKDQVKDPAKLYTYVDGTGKEIGEHYAVACDFGEDKAMVSFKDQYKYSIIDKSGKKISDKEFSSPIGFAEDPAGNMIFHDGLCIVDGGYIDATGNKVIALSEKMVIGQHFNSGISWVMVSKDDVHYRYLCINKKGDVLWSSEMNTAE